MPCQPANTPYLQLHMHYISLVLIERSIYYIHIVRDEGVWSVFAFVKTGAAHTPWFSCHHRFQFSTRPASALTTQLVIIINYSNKPWSAATKLWAFFFCRVAPLTRRSTCCGVKVNILPHFISFMLVFAIYMPPWTHGISSCVYKIILICFLNLWWPQKDRDGARSAKRAGRSRSK